MKIAYLHYKILTKEEVESLYKLTEYELQEEIQRAKEIKTYKEMPIDVKFYMQNSSRWAILKKIDNKYILTKYSEEEKAEEDITQDYLENRRIDITITAYEGDSRVNDLTQIWKDRFMLQETDCMHYVSTKREKVVECLNCKEKVVF